MRVTSEFVFFLVFFFLLHTNTTLSYILLRQYEWEMDLYFLFIQFVMGFFFVRIHNMYTAIFEPLYSLCAIVGHCWTTRTRLKYALALLVICSDSRPQILEHLDMIFYFVSHSLHECNTFSWTDSVVADRSYFKIQL